MTDKNKAGKKIKTAAALHYDPSISEIKAPQVIAKGLGAIAEKLVEIARKNNVPVEYNPALAQALASVDLLGEIPPELYIIVAEILVTVCDIEKKLWDDNNRLSQLRGYR